VVVLAGGRYGAFELTIQAGEAAGHRDRLAAFDMLRAATEHFRERRRKRRRNEATLASGNAPVPGAQARATKLEAITRDAPADVHTTNLVDSDLTPAVGHWAIVESSDES
jgi:hypothetical protein